MARTVVFVVQSFVASRRGALVMGPQRVARSASDAERIAQRIARMAAGAIAFSRSVDPDLNEVDAPLLIASFGRVPDEALEAS